MFRAQTAGDKLFEVTVTVLCIFICLIVMYPLIYVVSASFSNPLYVMQGKVWLWPMELTLNSYKYVFKTGEILVGYRNSLIYTVAGTALNVVMTVLGAYPLSRKDFVGRNIFTLIFTFTMFFGGGLIPSYLINQSLGLVNNPLIMILPGAVAMWNVIIVRTFFQNGIPKELQEASMIDGCSNTRLLMSIVLPLSTPVLAVITMYYAVGHWNSFMTALVYLTNKSLYPLQLVLRGILLQAEMTDMIDTSVAMTEQLVATEGLRYAVIIVASVPVLIMYPFLQKYFVKGVMVGAIKG